MSSISDGLPGSAGARIIGRCVELRQISANQHAYTRLYLTPEHRAAACRIAGWMTAAGASVRLDAVGNVIGRIEGSHPTAPALVLGSHFDTVRDAGTYDGILGVATAIEVAAGLVAEGRRLPFPIELHAYADEEGVRFQSMLLGSGFVTGLRGKHDLGRVDAEGVSLANALTEFGLDPSMINDARRQPTAFRAYLELHIEQGPVLDRLSAPLATVIAIAGQTRAAICSLGVAGHAGTVPMALRCDALAAASEVVLAIEQIARDDEELVATVGELKVSPGASNVIPGAVNFTLDLRSGKNERRQAALAAIRKEIRRIAKRRHAAIRMSISSRTAATTCDPHLVAVIDAVCEAVQGRSVHLVSGAGHDAIAMSALCPVGMIFVRCKGGVSHNPSESITEADADVGYKALAGAVRKLLTAI